MTFVLPVPVSNQEFQDKGVYIRLLGRRESTVIMSYALGESHLIGYIGAIPISIGPRLHNSRYSEDQATQYHSQ